MMQEPELHTLRQQIDELNKTLVRTLSERASVAQRIGAIKGAGPVYAPAREAQVLEQVRSLNPGPLSHDALEAIFKEVIAACRNLERQLVVAYLGPKGTYTQEAAQRHAGAGSTYVPYASIDETLAAVEKNKADIAVIPIENSSEGAVPGTLDLLLETRLQICGEIVMPIHHQLITKANHISDLTTIMGHPQALAQCRRWLAQHVPHASLLPVASNAEAAIQAAGNGTAAAIASSAAADIYGLKLLASDIQDSSNNTTRFVALGSVPTASTGNDKTSLVCSVPNKSGSLYKLLGFFAEEGINVTKLESRPSENTLWDYIFYVDLDGHEADQPLNAALQKAKKQATWIKVLGSYPKAAR